MRQLGFAPGIPQTGEAERDYLVDRLERVAEQVPAEANPAAG